jgi:hypothetical protein
VGINEEAAQKYFQEIEEEAVDSAHQPSGNEMKQVNLGSLAQRLWTSTKAIV